MPGEPEVPFRPERSGVGLTIRRLLRRLGQIDVENLVAIQMDLNLAAVDDNLLTPLISELIDFLGLKLGVAEVTMHGEPACANVKLVG